MALLQNLSVLPMLLGTGDLPPQSLHNVPWALVSLELSPWPAEEQQVVKVEKPASIGDQAAGAAVTGIYAGLKFTGLALRVATDMAASLSKEAEQALAANEAQREDQVLFKMFPHQVLSTVPSVMIRYIITLVHAKAAILNLDLSPCLVEKFSFWLWILFPGTARSAIRIVTKIMLKQ